MMVNSKIWKRRFSGIVARSLLAVFMVVLVLAIISSVLVGRFVDNRESQQVIKSLNQLVEAVSNTASIASFTQDELLAAEVVQGLMSNQDILRVTIHSNEGVLAQAEREGAAELLADLGDEGQFTYPLVSPFHSGELIGKILLDPDWKAVKAGIHKISRDALFVQIVQMTWIVAITAAIMFFLIVRPLKAISDRLHGLDGSRGSLLSVPRGHRNSELGQLVRDINALTGRLATTLEQERELQSQQVIARRKYQNLFDHAASGIFVADRQGQLDSFNPAFANLTWLTEARSTQLQFLTEIPWQEPEALLNMLAKSLDDEKEGAKYQKDLFLVNSLGVERWVNVAILSLGDGYVQGTLVDVTQRKKEEMSAQYQAVTDTLTGFSNRVGLQYALKDLSTTASPFALVMVDLNGFKQINEALGFHMGDQLLSQLATRLKAILTPKDHAARIDGDEFVLILQGEQERSAVNQRIEVLLKLLNQAYEVVATNSVSQSSHISITSKIGIAFFPSDGAQLNELLRSAELALTDSKDRNVSSYHYFSPEQQAAVEKRHKMEDALRQAVVAKELYLVFQPIVDLGLGQMVGAEALVRWEHPEEGRIAPDFFIPLAEELGLIDSIGLFVLEAACQQLVSWQAEGLGMYVSVNVSSQQIPKGLPPSAVKKLLEDYKLSPTSLAIEITEGLLIENVAVAQTWIENIRALGVSIYLDDFGTGYSSLSYLKRFPMDTVKIDRSFIRDLSLDKSDRALVAAIISMASSLDLKVVAEGVEDKEQLALLYEMGCGYVQGYYFSPPVLGEALAATWSCINTDLASNS